LYSNAQPHSGAAAILIDEFDAGFLEGTPDDIEGRAPRSARSGFQLVHCYETNTGLRCEVLLTPNEQTARTEEAGGAIVEQPRPFER